jgi:TolB-like protein/DNA-binding winged helix-turn-helix (wHTH) protein/tetratricopeptide (TPR) repeat protein
MTTSFLTAEPDADGRTGSLRFADFELDLESLELSRDGAPVALQPQPAQVLAALAEHAGQMVSRQELEDLLWPRGTHVDREQGLNYCIRQIRLALGDDSQRPRFVETLPRRGYRFVATLEPAAAETDEEAATTSARKRGGRFWAAAVAVALALGLVYLVLVPFLDSGAAPTPPPEPAERSRDLLAVLPLENLGGDDFLAAGLTEELSSTLGQLDPDHLAVIAQTAVERHPDLGVAEMGRVLGADHLLEGSVQRADGRLRVSVRLVQVEDQTQVWAKTYELEADDAFRVQREVARDVARALSLRLPALAPGDLGGTTSPQAFEVFLQGIQLLHRTPPDREAVTYLRQAVDLDPGFARAWTYLADAYRQRRPFDAAETTAAKEAVDRALELQPTSARAHLEAGLLALYSDYDVDAAQQHMERALDLQPSLALAHNHYAAVLAIRGRHRDALDAIHKALELDPGSLVDQADLGWFALCGRDYEAAIEDLRAVLAVAGPGQDYWARRHLLAAYVLSGAWEKAAEVATTWPETSFAGHAVEPVPGDPRATVEAFLRTDVADLREKYEARRSAPSNFAVDLALLGERQQAAHWLRVSADEGWGWQIPFLRVDPRFDGLRGLPAFQALIEELGLPQPAPADGPAASRELVTR